MSQLSRAFQRAMTRHVNADVTVYETEGGDFEAQTKTAVLEASCSYQEGTGRLRQERYLTQDAEAVLYLVQIHTGALADITGGQLAEIEYEDGRTETMTVLGARRTDRKVILKR